VSGSAVLGLFLNLIKVDEDGRSVEVDGLRPACAALARFSAALANDRSDTWKAALIDAQEIASPVEIEEVLLQSCLFVGFPVVLNAFEALRAQDIGCAEELTEVSLTDHLSVGEELCARIYGEAYDSLRENIRNLHPDLDRWVIADGYGRTLSRPGLSVCDRELCIVAQLAAGRHVRQLKAHLFGALNVGATPEAVESVLEIGIASGTREDRVELLSLWGEIKRRVGL